MRDDAGKLEGKQKGVGCLVFPFGYGLLGGDAVECAVNLNRVKLGGVITQKIFGHCFLRVKVAFPEAVAPAYRA